MRRHRSYSQLSGFEYCGHRFYLQKIRKYPEQPSVWSAAGTAFHVTAEEIDLADGWNDTGPVDFWQDRFTDNFELGLDEMRKVEPDETKWRRAGRPTKDKPNKEDVLWWHVNGREMVEKYIAWRVSTVDVWEIATVNGAPAIEVEVLSPLGDVPMKGYIDRLLRSKIDHRLCVVDLKSGSRMPTSPMQLATYSVQVEELVGEPVLWGAFYDARKGTLAEPIDLTRFTAERLGNVYEMLDRGIEAGVFLPNIDTHCNGCGVREFCIYQGGIEKPLGVAA